MTDRYRPYPQDVPENTSVTYPLVDISGAVIPRAGRVLARIRDFERPFRNAKIRERIGSHNSGEERGHLGRRWYREAEGMKPGRVIKASNIASHSPSFEPEGAENLIEQRLSYIDRPSHVPPPRWVEYMSERLDDSEDNDYSDPDPIVGRQTLIGQVEGWPIHDDDLDLTSEEWPLYSRDHDIYMEGTHPYDYLRDYLTFAEDTKDAPPADDLMEERSAVQDSGISQPVYERRGMSYRRREERLARKLPRGIILDELTERQLKRLEPDGKPRLVAGFRKIGGKAIRFLKSIPKPELKAWQGVRSSRGQPLSRSIQRGAGVESAGTQAASANETTLYLREQERSRLEEADPSGPVSLSVAVPYVDRDKHPRKTRYFGRP